MQSQLDKKNPQWENEHPWLRYSISKEATYCIYCILFGNKLSKRGNQSLVFQHSGFTDWKNAKGIKRSAFTLHEASENHKTAAMKALAFRNICEGKLQDIRSRVSKEYDDEIELFYYQ